MLKSGFNACSGLNCLAKPFGFGQYAKHTVFVNDLYMIKAILYACVLLAGAHCAAAENAEALGVKNVSFKENWDSRRVLKNPGKGWYHHILDNGVDNYKIFDEAVFESFPFGAGRLRGGRREAAVASSPRGGASAPCRGLPGEIRLAGSKGPKQILQNGYSGVSTL